MRRYVWRDLARNGRRTLASLGGVTLGVALFAAVLFFVDGSGATMTRRAIAPLALDMQRVLSAPLGNALRLEQRVVGGRALRAGQRARIVLTVRNRAAVAANEVVVNDEPPPPLAYVHGSMRRAGRRLPDVAGQSPLAQGLARSGLNIGTVAAGGAVRLSYRVRATRGVGAVSALALRATISSRERVVPARANAPAGATVEQLAARLAAVPGVAAADALSFVDLPPGSLRAGPGAQRPARPARSAGRGTGPGASGATRATGATGDGVRVFAFDARYARRYPSIRLVAGSFAPDGALLSVEAARALGVRTGETVRLRLPGRRRPLVLRVGGVADLARARPLFHSRKARRLEDFVYVPDSVVVSPATFRRAVLPAFRAAAARRGGPPLKALPLAEVDVRVQRSRLATDPGRALAQTRAVARAVAAVAPGQDELIDNISNTLAVARADAAVGRRMFVFLGLPGVLLAAFLTAYAGTILAAAGRREQAILRIRGADRGHLVRMLAHRTLALAGAGSLAGVAVGFLSAMAVLGPDTLLTAAPADLLGSAALAVTAGMLVTALALYVPGRRALRREIGDERSELGVAQRRGHRERSDDDGVAVGRRIRVGARRAGRGARRGRSRGLAAVAVALGARRGGRGARRGRVRGLAAVAVALGARQAGRGSRRRRARVLAALVVAAVGGVVAVGAARFEPAAGSVSEGRAVEAMPAQLLLAPLMLWCAGALAASRGAQALASRMPLPARYGSPLWGTLRRGLRRRARSLGPGIAGLVLVVALGTALALFSATYDAAKAADAAFTVGSDLRVTPSVVNARPQPAAYATELDVAGVAGVTPVSSRLDNAVLIGPYDQDRATLTAIEPRSFARVAALSDGLFAGGSAAVAMGALRGDPRALLVEAESADALSIEPGMRVRVLLARGTKRQRLQTFRVAGLFDRFPGFPQGTSLVANLDAVRAATGSPGVDFFLLAAADRGDAGLERAVAALRGGPGETTALNVETTATALDKDQSSLTALNVRGLVELDTVYTLLMSAAVIAIFVFGLMLERRREYVTLRAQGMGAGELRALVLGEAAVVATGGLVAGLAVGAGVAVLLVSALRPLFILPPSLAVPAGDLALVAGLAAVATLAAALAATALLARLRPAELLRDW